jgi:hypothetical protein
MLNDLEIRYLKMGHSKDFVSSDARLPAGLAAFRQLAFQS